MTKMVSVIIPSYNACQTIEECVESVLRTEYSPLEVVVVDDASTDDTALKADTLRARYPDLVRLVRMAKNGGPSRARNRGAEQATGELLFFLDADTQMLPDTLPRFVRRIEETGAHAICGTYDRIPLNPGVVPRYKAYVSSYLFSGDGLLRYNVFITSCAGIRSDVFRRLRGFDPDLRWGLDVEGEEFGRRIAQNHIILLDPEVKVRHHFPNIGKLTLTYFHRVSIWMELFLKTRTFEKTGATTLKTGLSTASAAAVPLTAFLALAIPEFSVLPGLLILVHVFGYAGFFRFVAKQDPAFVPLAVFLNYYCSIVLSAGAAYGVLRILLGMGRLPPRVSGARTDQSL